MTNVWVHDRMKICCQDELKKIDKARQVAILATPIEGAEAKGGGANKPKEVHESLYGTLGALSIPAAIIKLATTNPLPANEFDGKSRDICHKICTTHEELHRKKNEFRELLFWALLRGELSSLPVHVPVDTDTYYMERYKDFVRRHPNLPPPRYYLGYGQVYYDAFKKSLRPKLSSPGQAWVDRTATLLQQKMEERVGDTVAQKIDFDQLERSDESFKAFAYATHCDAYVEAGITDLSASDQWTIANEPALADLMSGSGISQILCVGAHEAYDLAIPKAY